MGALNSVPAIVVALTLLFIVVVTLFINVIYYHLKEKDTKNTMSIYWEKLLFWVNVIAIVFGLLISLYFVVQLLLAISKSRKAAAAATAAVGMTAPIIGAHGSAEKSIDPPSIISTLVTNTTPNYMDQMQKLVSSITASAGKVMKIHQNNLKISVNTREAAVQELLQNSDVNRANASGILKDTTALIKDFNAKSASEKASVVMKLQQLDKESSGLLKLMQQDSEDLKSY